MQLGTMSSPENTPPKASGAASGIILDTASPPPGVDETLLKNITAIIEKATSANTSGALLLIHISNLSMILSGYGHDMAEQVIRDIIGRIQFILSTKDLIERTGRDQIMVVLQNSHPEESERMALRISTIIQNYGRDTFATSSLHVLGFISSVHFPDETQHAIDALDKAYAALHGVEDSIYRPHAVTKLKADECRQQMGLASYFYTAYQEKRLRLAWQPVLDVKQQRIAHYEALLRIKSTNGKISSAGALIPVAEKMGLIDKIDEFVLEMVVAELRRAPQLTLALNVSNVTTENHIWLDHLQALVEETPDIASRIIVEITETAAQRDLRRVAYFVACLQAMGCQVALDDFGSGYTSFRQLKSLSVDFVKIDGIFIKDIAKNTDSRFFVKTLLDFIRGFGLKSVAEFVENGEVAKILMDMGMDYLQGYYLGKPENNRTWLQSGEYKPD